MADNLLLNYMVNRFKIEEDKLKEEVNIKKHSPFITISRQFGCPSGEIAKLLHKKLNEHHKKWSIINKEILEQSAKELEIHPKKLNYIFNAEKRNSIDEILMAMSTKKYKSDKAIRKIIKDIVISIALAGHKIIIGRGGVSILNDFPNSLHIRLFAPLEWRLEQIEKKHTFQNRDKAISFINEMDKQRINLIKQFYPKEFGFDIFDLQYNCSRISSEEITHQIYQLLLRRELL